MYPLHPLFSHSHTPHGGYITEKFFPAVSSSPQACIIIAHYFKDLLDIKKHFDLFLINMIT